MTIKELIESSKVKLSFADRCKLGQIVAKKAREKEIPFGKIKEVDGNKRYKAYNYPLSFKDDMVDCLLWLTAQ